MSLTGTAVPQGTTTSQESVYLEQGPSVYFEDYNGNYRFSPDSDGFYWGLSGTSTYPAYAVGCYQNFHWKDNVSMNDIRCDALGVVATMQHRNFMEVTFDLQSFFPLSVLAKMLKGAHAVTNNASDEAEKFGLDKIDNNKFWKVYFPLVYDQDASAYLAVTLHKAQFVDSWDWNMQYGASHSIGITLRAFADAARPNTQRFATVVRVDASVL